MCQECKKLKVHENVKVRYQNKKKNPNFCNKIFSKRTKRLLKEPFEPVAILGKRKIKTFLLKDIS